MWHSSTTEQEHAFLKWCLPTEFKVEKELQANEARKNADDGIGCGPRLTLGG